MPWWAWALIVIGVIGIGVVKVTVLNRWMARRKEAALKKAEEE